MTKNRRNKIKIRLLQTVTGSGYLEARRHVVAPSLSAAERVAVQPALSDWLRAKFCASWEESQREHGPLIALRISKGPGWWELDDLARAAAGALQNRPPARRGLWLQIWPGYTVTRREYLPGILANLDRAGVLHRLEVREIPDATGCTHATCRNRRGLPPLPRSERQPTRPAPLFEPRPLRPPTVAFAEVIKRNPTLDSNGFNCGPSNQERRQAIELSRRELISRKEIVHQVHDWLVVNIATIKTPTVGSYELKHLAEELLGEYISNGELITAALMAGYPMRRVDGPNALFGMSRRDLTRLRKDRDQACRAGLAT